MGKFTDAFTIKKFKSMQGMECAVIRCDLYSGSTKLGSYFDEGSGGGGRVDWQDKATFDKVVKDNDLKAVAKAELERAFGRELTFPIDDDSILCCLMDEYKELKVLKRYFKKALVIRAGDGFDIFPFYYKGGKKVFNIEKVLKESKLFRDIVQERVNELSAKGEKVINTNLSQFGIQV